MILFGASGHAKVIIDILECTGQKVSFLVDANPEIKKLLQYDVIHDTKFLITKEPVLLSIGNNQVRKRLARELNVGFGRAIHPKSILDKSVKIGLGSVVMAGAIINNSSSIGQHCIINTSASIDHDCILEDFVHVSPNATLCGTIKVGEGAHIGSGATIIPNLKIGKWAVVGAGAVIISDVPDYAVVVGNPGKIIKYNNE